MIILSDAILAKMSIPTRNLYLSRYASMLAEQDAELAQMSARESVRQATLYQDAVERIEGARYRAA
jgi:acyl-CoA reductase-like NAD-dependent aldehyde dehydrogenase